jgi:hypothetical protein
MYNDFLVLASFFKRKSTLSRDIKNHHPYKDLAEHIVLITIVGLTIIERRLYGKIHAGRIVIFFHLFLEAG